MRIAIFRHHVSATIEYESVINEDGAKYRGPSSTRVSEWVDVDFPPCAADELVPEQLAMLDAAENELRAKFQEKLNELAEQRSKLRAITFEPQP